MRIGYDGNVKLYLFDNEDPLILAYEHLFPGLLTPVSEMPADVRRHTRFPELLFRVQAELYRTYHMRVPDSFYNRADLWDLATFTSGQGGIFPAGIPVGLVTEEAHPAELGLYTEARVKLSANLGSLKQVWVLLNPQSP